MSAPAEYLIRDETWEDIAGEADALFSRHFQEVDAGVEPRRPYQLDKILMAQIFAAGALQITAARNACRRLVGYCMWIIMPDMESQGLTIAQHGPWFVEPGHPRVGRKLLNVSIEGLKKRGVHVCYPHHRLQGRGERLGKLYKRLGAKEIQHTYSLWIGA